MKDESRRAIVHLVEPQHLFVQALAEVFAEAGLSIDNVADAVDPRRVLDDGPDIVFVDTDYLAGAADALRHLRYLAPQAVIAAYTSSPPAIIEGLRSAGADVVIEKSAERRCIVQRLREMEHRRRDRRHDV